MKARVRTPSATRSASRSAASEDAARRSGAPFSPVNRVSAGCHIASDTSPRGEQSPVTASTSRPVSRAGRGLGLGDGGRGEHERRPRAVRRADPAQPAEHLGDVRPEDPAVVVALVDHDVAELGQEGAPALVAGQQRAVQHVRVGQHVLRVVARPLALVAAAVAVVGGDPDVEAERGEPGELVLGQRLGRREVEGGGAALAARPASGQRRGQRRQLVGERLARGGAGGEDDVLSGVRRVGCHRLVLPGLGRRHGRGRPRAPPGRPSPATARCAAGRAGSRSRWVSRPSRPGTAASRSITSAMLPRRGGGGHAASMTNAADVVGRRSHPSG